MSLLSWLLVILAGLSLAIMVISISIANRSAREARSTIFPIVREEETIRARRARIATSVTGVIAAIMAGAFFLSGQLPSLSIPIPTLPAELVAIVESPATEEVTPATPTNTPTETSIPPTEEQTPTPTQVALATDQPSADETPSPPTTSTLVLPTLTPTPTIPTPTLAGSATPTPIPPSPTLAGSPIPAPASVQLGPIAFTTQISERREPISPTTVFSDTVSRVYAAFPYTGMRNGLTWTQIWYFDDVEFSRGEESWEWGSADRSFVFTNLVGSGDYRLELYVNDDLVASGAFRVRGPIAVGGPETRESPGTPESPGGTETPESP
jgi:hypothetical protein